MAYPSNTYAIKIADIIPILRKYNTQLKCEDGKNISDLTPEYAKKYANREFISLQDATILLCKHDPSTTELQDSWGNDSSPVDYDYFYSLLERASLSSKIIRNQQGLYSIKSIQSFCLENDLFFPIPTTNLEKISASGKDREIQQLKEQIKKANQKIMEQEENAQFIIDTTKIRDKLKDENTALLSRNIELEKINNELIHKIDTLNRDIIQGKSRTTYQQILGGLVTSTLYVDIFKDGNLESGTILSCLEQVGIKIAQETITKYLREAANKLQENGEDKAIIQYLEKHKK